MDSTLGESALTLPQPPFLCGVEPYVYVLIGYASDLERGVIYVGQTRSRKGPAGRLAEHLAPHNVLADAPGTFRMRCQRYGVDNLDWLRCYFYDLPSRPLFAGRASDGREAVEFVVASRVKDFIARRRLRLLPIAWVRSNSLARTQEVSTQVERISPLIEARLVELSLLYC